MTRGKENFVLVKMYIITFVLCECVWTSEYILCEGVRQRYITKQKICTEEVNLV